MLIAPVIYGSNSVRPLRDTDRDQSDARSRRDGNKPQTHNDGKEAEGQQPGDDNPAAAKHIDVMA